MAEYVPGLQLQDPGTMKQDERYHAVHNAVAIIGLPSRLVTVEYMERLRYFGVDPLWAFSIGPLNYTKIENMKESLERRMKLEAAERISRLVENAGKCGFTVGRTPGSREALAKLKTYLISPNNDRP